MTAIGALACVGMPGGIRKDRCVVLLSFRSRLISHRLQHMLRIIHAYHNCRHRRTCQHVVDALHRRQGHTKRRPGSIKQAASGIALHHGNADISAFTEFIELCPGGIHTAKMLVVLLGKIRIQVLCWRHQIKSRVDAEQDHLHDSALYRFFRHSRVVGAHADMPDHTLFLLLQHIPQEGAVYNCLPVLRRVHKMDHPQIDVIGLQSCQQVLKGRHHLLHIPGPDILPILPCGSKMPLNDPFLPAALQCFANIRAHIGFAHPAVQNIDPLSFARINDRAALLLVMPLQPLCSQSNFTDQQTRCAQGSVSHKVPPVFFKAPGPQQQAEPRGLDYI